MSHIKTVKESIKDVIDRIESNDPKEIEKAVNSIDLMIQTMLRQERLKYE